MGTKYFLEAFLLHLSQRKDFYEPDRQDCMNLQKWKCSTIFSWENMHSLQKFHRIFLLYFSLQVIFLFKFYINITIIIMLITGHLSWGLNIIQSNIILFVCLFAFKCLLLYNCSLHLTLTHHLCFLYQFPWFLLSCQQGPNKVSK